MLIPIGTEVRPRRPPIGNYALIVLNVLVFLYTDYLGGAPGRQLKSLWTLYAAVPDLWQYLTYQFLHGDIVHLLGNMLFLWIFGNAVCDRMGSLSYVLFYLAGGVFAGIIFSATNTTGIVGASGAIAAVTTAFLVLYPRVRITLLLWFFVITAFQVPAMILIVFKIILWDNVIAPGLDQGVVSNVAYSAHLGGYAFGFVAGMLLLALRVLPRNQFDLLALWDRWNRRRSWPAAAPAARGRPIRAEEMASRPLQPLEPTPAERLRNEIIERVLSRDLPSAAERYRELRRLDPTQVLPREAQLELANHLAQVRRHAEAAGAYEAYLTAYPEADDRAQVRLLLGLIYSRYLHDPNRAGSHLREALAGLTEPNQRALAEEELSQLGSAGGSPDVPAP